MSKTINVTLDNYPRLAMVTLADKGPILNRTHVALGVKSEAGEVEDLIKRAIFYNPDIQDYDLKHVPRDKFILELGDICWYLGCLCHMNNIPFSAIVVEPNEDITDIELMQMADHVFKKASDLSSIIYSNYVMSANHETVHSDAIDKEVGEIIATICHMAAWAGTTIEDVVSKNIHKLNARFGDKFDAFLAKNRDTDNEEKVAAKA